MKAIRELSPSEREALKSKHISARHFKTHFSDVIDETYCYEIALYASDYAKIWIQSFIFGPNAPAYQKLSEVIDYLNSQGGFTKVSDLTALDLQQIKNYVDVLSQCNEQPEECFDKMSNFNCFLLDRHGIEVTDGMHRLVAYGLFSNLGEEYFPISVYLGTNKSQQEVESI